jgi:hypothetical protein
MRNIIFAVILISVWITPINAQWIQTTLPGTSTIFCIATDSAHIYTGTYIFGAFRSTDFGSDWQVINTGLPDTNVLSMTVNDSCIFAGTYNGIFRSTDHGNQWAFSGFSGRWIYALACNGSKISAGSDSGHVFFSDDNGADWIVRKIPSIDVAVKALAVTDSGIFAGTNQSGIFLSTDDGAEWIQVNSGSSFNDINSIVINGSRIFAGGTGGVYVSTDNGMNWTAINNGLTSYYVQALAVHDSRVFAGSQGEGGFYSSDNGSHWTAMNDGLTGWGNYITCLNVVDTLVLAGTDGAGLWRRPLSEFVMQVDNGDTPLTQNFILQQNYPNPFNTNTTIRYAISNVSNVSIIIYNVLGQTVKTLVNGRKDAGNYEVSWNGKDDDGHAISSGIYIYKLKYGITVKTNKMMLLK